MTKEKIIKFFDFFIEYGILAIIFFIPIIIDFSLTSYNFFDLYRAIVFRLILTLILLAYIAKIFFSGKISYRGGSKIFFLTGFLLVSFFISSLFSVHPGDSFWGSFLRQQGFYNFFHYLLFFVLIVLNLKDFKQVKKIIIAVMASAFLAVIYGLVQYFNFDPIRWTESGLNAGRIFSFLGQPNFFGHYLILIIPLSLYCLIFMAKSVLSRFFIGLILLAQLACLIFTYSRAAWLGFLGSMVFLLIFWLLYKRFKKTVYIFISLLLVGLGLVILLNLTDKSVINAPAPLGIINRIKSMTDFKSGSGKMRFYYIKYAFEEIKHESPLRLLVGSGPETLTSLYLKYYQIDWGIYETINTTPDRAHNWLLDQFLTLGILGFLATLSFYIFIIYKAAKFILERPRLGNEDWLLIFLFASLVAYFINNLFSFSLFTVLVYLYLILALAWFIINYRQEEKIINIRFTIFSKLLIWLALLACSAVFIYTNNINQARAEIYYIKAIKSFRVSDFQGVLGNFNKIMELSPNSSYYQENYLFLLLNCLPVIKNKIDLIELYNNILSHIEKIDDKEYYGLKLNLARSYTLFGLYFDKAYYNQAEKIYNDLILIYPNTDLIYEGLAQQKSYQGDDAAAVELFKRAVDILPPLNHPELNPIHRQQVAVEAIRLYEKIGQAYVKIKNYDQALVYFKKALSLDPYRPILYKNIADIYYINNDLNKAVEFNKRGFMLNSGDYHWPLSLSLLYRDKKDLPAAKDYLNKALKLAPENEDLKKYYKELNN